MAHHQWHAEATARQRLHAASPDDLALAKEYWTSIDGAAGYDARTGLRVIETFRLCALKSDEGLAEMLTAFRRLADATGEYPRATLFEPPLENLIRYVAAQPDHCLASDASWLVSYLD